MSKVHKKSTRAWKRDFIRTFMKSVNRKIMEAVPNMPAEWDGFELRQFMADHFQHEIVKMDRKRMRSYKNDFYQMPR